MAESIASKSGIAIDPTNPPILLELVCQICNRLFSRPKQLNFCGHVFCSECLQGLAKPGHKPGSMKIECPSCQMVSHMSHGPEKSLRTNLPLYNMAEAVRAYQKQLQGQVPAASKLTPPPPPPPPPSGPPPLCCPDYALHLPTILCTHCNAEFCMQCEQPHYQKVRTQAIEIAKELVPNIKLFIEQVDFIEERTKALPAEFEKSFQDLSNKIHNSFPPPFGPDYDGAVKLLDEARSIGEAELAHLATVFHKWQSAEKQKSMLTKAANLVSGDTDSDVDFGRIFGELRDGNEDLSFIVGFASFNTPHFDFDLNPDLPSKIEMALRGTSLGSVSYRMAPPSPVYIEAHTPEMEEPNIYFPTDRVETPPLPPVDAMLTPDPTPIEPTFDHLAPYNHLFYGQLSLSMSIDGADSLGVEILKPTGCCLISVPDVGPVVAVIHNIRRISLVSVSKLEATFEVGQPEGDVEYVVLGTDIACDSKTGLICVTCHNRSKILSFSISPVYHVTPRIFARAESSFYGLVISEERRELLTATEEAIAGFSLESGDITYNIPYPSSFSGWRYYLCGAFGSCDLLKVVCRRGDNVHIFSLPRSGEVTGDFLSQPGEAWPLEELDDEQPFRTIAVDPVGNMLVFQPSAQQLNLYTTGRVKMCSVVLEDLEPNSFVVVSSYDSCDSPYLVVTNWSDNSIRFYH